MADERTASNFTWYNSAIRNRQDVKTLTNMIQVRQWYLNEDESVPPQTHPVVRWSKLTPSVLASREKPLHPNDDIFEDWPAHVDPRAAPSHSVEAAPMASDRTSASRTCTGCLTSRRRSCGRLKDKADSEADDVPHWNL
ncbi:hypothetical protein L227DRAFT_569592 [Lentinus tigrinus ALCF2SS1-6]|uniref:Uncharacterized protein n=1 Tax=Lentinus tigrinus ALCF2SS1-6 TaxID=1328759 RepID=A0A5C2SUD0_9APHY|nr:hypothetical protein L227DRAFT_569592 [Lentinus tigrinus ALCF2SS1-6]